MIDCLIIVFATEYFALNCFSCLKIGISNKIDFIEFSIVLELICCFPKFDKVDARIFCRIYVDDIFILEVGFMLYLSCENNLEGRCLVVITGKVKWFNNEKGYGFIEYKDNEDIFVHYSSILSEGYKTLVEGQYVKFDLVRTDKGLQAKNVIEIKTALV